MSNKFQYLVFDLETSGLPLKNGYRFFPAKQINKYNNCRITELGYTVFNEKQEKIKDFSTLIQPNDFQVSEESVAITGIKQTDLEKDGIPLEDALLFLEIDLYSVDVIISHNLDFDYHVLQSECYRQFNYALLQELKGKMKHCTFKMAKKAFPSLVCHKLDYLYSSLFCKEIIQTHRSLDDCTYCAKCYFKMLNNYEYLIKLQIPRVKDYEIQFGKYKTYTVEQVYDLDPSYCRFILDQDFQSGDFNEFQFRLQQYNKKLKQVTESD